MTAHQKRKKVCFFDPDMKCSLRSLPVFTLLLFSFIASAQRFDSILSKLDKEYPQEKVYLQFDRQVYYPGETIWTKAYLFAGNDLSLISRTLYADLIDEKGKVLQRKTAPLLESSASLAFDLPVDIKGKLVYVRAYTRWMLNFDTAFLFVKAIPLVAKKGVATKVTPAPEQDFLQFFPEGGNLVIGLSSRIAFKATDAYGQPVNTQGDIVDGNGKKIISFKPTHDGMGVFSLQPLPETQYKAVWKDYRGIAHETILPTPKKQGVVLQLTNAGTMLNYNIQKTPDSLERFKQLYIVVQEQQQLLYRARANLSKTDQVTGSIPIAEIPAGIVQVTLFDAFQQPIAERIVFANQQDYYFITDLNAASMDLNKRKRNVIQIDVPDTIRCNLSVAVTDAALNPGYANADNIFSHILLTSDIKGYVHDPGYYFATDADSVVKNLDLVMMTNGWRRFNWEDVLTNHYPVILNKPENYLAIEGNVYGIPKTTLAQKEVSGILELKNKNKQFLTAAITNEGTFSIPGLIFFDTAHVYYQFNNDKNKTLTSRASFEVKNNLLPYRLFVQPEKLWTMGSGKHDSMLIVQNKDASDKYAQELDKQLKVKVLSEVVVKAKQRSKKEIMEDEYTSGLFKGSDDITFIMDDDPTATSALSIFNYLQGRVAGLTINLTGSQPSLSWRGGTPTLFLNEIENDAQSISNVSMSDVAMVKVFRPPFFGATGGGSGGAIAVYLKKGAAVNKDFKGLDFTAIEGYSPIKEFYSPDYSKADAAFDQDDYRATLYWNPFVITNKDHKRILLSFYNNDVTRKIRIVIEGCNAEGKLTRIEKIFQ